MPVKSKTAFPQQKLATGKAVLPLPIGNWELHSAAFSPDGTRIVTAENQGVQIYDAGTGVNLLPSRERSVLEIVTISDHGEGIKVHCAKFTPDGTRIVSGCSDGSLQVWDARTGAYLNTLEGHRLPVESLEFSPDGGRMVTTGGDTALLWDTQTGDNLLELSVHGSLSWVQSAEFSPDSLRIVTASDDSTARIWDAATGEELAVCLGHEGKVTAAEFSQDGSWIVTASKDATARIWDARTGEERIVFEGHNGPLVSAEFSPDGTYVLTASEDGTSRAWDGQTGEELAVLEHGEPVASAHFGPDGTLVVTASSEHKNDFGRVQLWDIGLARPIRNPLVPGLWYAAFSPDGSKIVTASMDRTARLWDSETGEQLVELFGHKSDVRTAVFSPDKRRIITVAPPDAARLWDAQIGQQISVVSHDYKDFQSGPTAAVFNADGTQFITTPPYPMQDMRVWSAASGQQLMSFEAGCYWGSPAVFSMDQTRILLTSQFENVYVWNLQSGEHLMTLGGGADHISFGESKIVLVAESPDGQRIVGVTDKGDVRMWDSDTGDESTIFTGHKARINSIDFTSDSECFVTASDDKSARVWDVKTGAELLALAGHDGWVLSAKFSPDDKWILTASWDGTACLWDAASGVITKEFSEHGGPVMSAKFSPDGTRILTASQDGLARVWDPKTGSRIGVLLPTKYKDSSALNSKGTRAFERTVRPERTRFGARRPGHIMLLEGHKDSVASAAFCPQGSRAVTVSDDGTARVWDLDSGSETSIYDINQFLAFFSADGSDIIGVRSGYPPRVYQASSESPLFSFPEDIESRVTCMSFSIDQKSLLAGSEDGSVRVWVEVREEAPRPEQETSNDNTADPAARIDAIIGSLPTWRAVERLILEGHDGAIESARYNPDETRIVTASRDGTARLWNAETGEQITTFEGHGDWITDAVSSPDDSWIATASNDNTARIWDTMTGDVISTLKGHRGAVHTLNVRADGKYLVTASSDGTARVWIADTGKEKMVLRHDADVVTASFSPDGSQILTASLDRTARLWDVESGNLLRILEHQTGLNNAAYSPDGLRIVTTTVGQGQEVNVWNVASGELLLCPRLLDSYVLNSGLIPSRFNDKGSLLSALFSPDGKHMVAVSADNMVYLWDLAALKYPTSISHQDEVNSVVFSADGSFLLTSSEGGKARVLDVATGEELHSFDHDAAVTLAELTKDSTTVVACTETHKIYWWDSETGKERRSLTLVTTSDAPYPVYSQDGSRLILENCDDVTLPIWDAKTGVNIGVSFGYVESDGYTFEAMSPSGSFVILRFPDGTRRVCDTHSGKQLVDLEGFGDDQECDYETSFSEDESHFVVEFPDGTLDIYDLSTGSKLFALSDLTQYEEIEFCAFSPDKSRIATRCMSNEGGFDLIELVILDAATGGPLTTLRNQPRISPSKTPESQALLELATGELLELSSLPETTNANLMFFEGFNIDGSRVLTSSVQYYSGESSNYLSLWDVSNGEKIIDISVPGANVSLESWNPDRARFVTEVGGVVEVWDMTTGEKVASIGKHGQESSDKEYEVYKTFSNSNGMRLITTDNEDTVCIWNGATGEPVGDSIRLSSMDVDCGVVSPDGSRIIIGVADGTVIVWDLETGSVLARLKLELTVHDNIKNITVCDNASVVVVETLKDDVHLWNSETGEDLGNKMQWDFFREKNLSVFGISPDGTHIVTSCGIDRTVRVWDVDSGESTLIIPYDIRDMELGALSPELNRAATFYESDDFSYRVLIWDLETGACLGQGLGLVLCPVSSRLIPISDPLALYNDAVLRIWNRDFEGAIVPPAWHRTDSVVASLSPDGSRILVVDGNEVVVKDVSSGTPLVTLIGHSDEVTSVRFSPDGTRIITTSADSTVRIWNALPFREDQLPPLSDLPKRFSEIRDSEEWEARYRFLWKQQRYQARRASLSSAH